MNRRIHTIKAAAMILSFVVALMVSWGVPLHLSHHHAHDHAGGPNDLHSIHHTHTQHEIGDHDWNGLRAKALDLHCLAADQGVSLSPTGPQPKFFFSTQETPSSRVDLGRPLLRAPPLS